MTKRKREAIANGDASKRTQAAKKAKAEEGNVDAPASQPTTLQVIAGSYDRVLHGVTATVTPQGTVQFADTFLFNAHSSAIRCLAVSSPSLPVPRQGQKVMLATGSTDERINIYNLSAHPPRKKAVLDLISSIAPRPITESSKNRELGTLLHHASTVNKLCFPTRSKLLSGSEDSSIAVTRTRDWSLLSSIKAPIPKLQGRPSGDTAAVGGGPCGINDFAIHPSMKLMISVGKGERCMRLWNLLTGKKAGVLNFGRDILEEAGETKYATGEGRKVVWGRCAAEDEFAVAFDRNIIVFTMDSRPKCKVMPDSKTKVHQLRYLALEDEADILAVSTEDGRILFYKTGPTEQGEDSRSLPLAKLMSQLGGKEAGVSGRIKDFSAHPVAEKNGAKAWLFVTAGSDGKLAIWRVAADDLNPAATQEAGKQVGQLLGTYETQNRITCVESFIMIPRPEGVEESEDEDGEESEVETDEESDED